MQERRHLPPGHIRAWAEAVVDWWVTPQGHPGCGEFVDVACRSRQIRLPWSLGVCGLTWRVDGAALLRRARDCACDARYG